MIAGHIHTYERFERNGFVFYLVSAGEGRRRIQSSAPRRTLSGFLHSQRSLFVFALPWNRREKGTMYRLANPGHFPWEVKETF